MHSLAKAIRFLYGLGGAPDSPGGPEPDGPEPDGPPVAPDARAAEPCDAGAGWVHWIVPLGLAVGVLLALITALSWRWLALGHGGNLWVAVAPVLLIYWLGPGTGRYLGWGRTLSALRLGRRLDGSAGRSPLAESVGLVALAMLAAGVLQYVCIAVLPTATRGFDRLPAALNRLLFPRNLYGALVLMGLWGNGSVLLSGCIGPPADDADRSVRRLLALPLWVKAAWGLGPPIALATLFLVGWRWRWGADWVSTVALAVAHALAAAVILFGIAMLYGWLLARRGQGHCRSTLLAGGLIGEIASLIVFHALVK